MAVGLTPTAAAVQRSTFRARISCLVPTLWIMFTPGLACAQLPRAQGNAPGVLTGAVKDDSGSLVTGAIVTLETVAATGQRTAITDQAGSFRFSAVEPGNYNIAIAADGFTLWTAANVAVRSDGNQPPLSAVL